MAQVIRCPHCGKTMQLPEQAAGKQVRCPHPACHKVFLVPAPAPQSPATPPVVSPVNGAPAAGPVALVKPPEAAPTPPPAPALQKCPACKATLLPGAIACMDCGYLFQPATGSDDEGPPSLCPNPACGVANSPRDRHCQRCGSPLPTPPGTALHGRYRIEHQLAVGGFGAVYLATDTKAGNRRVAIKDMICADPQEFDIRLNFFRREAEILRSLESLPIVPRVFDFIQQDQTAHLVLEYIHGRNLLQVLETNDNRPFPVPQVVEWGKDICDVLAHMHGQTPPLVHRDMKPDNIMLLEDRQQIKLIDFGTARDVGRTRQSQLAAKTRVFTEGYAPPEQIVGKPEPRSDLFALAGTLYHLATGKAPAGVVTARELESQLADPNGPLPVEDRWFFELLKINLADDVAARYFSAREFKADLEQGRVSRELACPHCGASNPVREPYCLKCAHPLTDSSPPCTYCGKTNRLGSRWCIYCGHRLR